jgi:hypothetical protein
VDGTLIQASAWPQSFREKSNAPGQRKLIERVFGWSKLDRVLRQVKLRGLPQVDWFYRLVVGYNLVRMRKPIPISALVC